MAQNPFFAFVRRGAKPVNAAGIVVYYSGKTRGDKDFGPAAMVNAH
jgi:hypothetical protein